MKTKKLFFRLLCFLAFGGLCFIMANPQEVNAANKNTCKHSSKSWVTVVSPTCATPGQRNYVCSDCGTIFDSASLPQVPSHSYNRSSASCTEDKVCSVCGTVAQRKTGHSMSWVTVSNPTCTLEGYREYKCSKCGTITNSSSIGRVSHSPNMSSATCTDDQQCTMCGYVMQSKTGHHYVDQYYVTTPTCNKGGAMLQKCSGCGNTKTVAVGPTYNHKYETKTTAATCTEAGSSEDVCKVCGAKKNVTSISALGHLFNEAQYTVVTKPTGTTPGVGKCYCQRSGCNASKDVTIPPTGIIEKPVEKDEDPCKNGHTSNGVQKKEDSTCYKEGYQVTVCSRCGAELGNRTVIAKKNHSWDNGKVISSSDTYDVYLYHCTNSGCSETKNENKEKNITIADDPCKNGHTSNGNVHKDDSTCYKEGYLIMVCSRCGSEFGPKTVIPKKEHKWDSGTLFFSGSSHTVYKYHCTNPGCTAEYSEEGPGVDDPETLFPSQVDSSGCRSGVHSWSKYVETSVATCKSGAIYTRKCTVSGCNATDSYTGPIGDHLFKKVTVKATCTQTGHTGMECCFCGKLINYKETALKKHKYTEWQCDQKEDCYMMGHYQRHCKVCGKYDYKKVNPLEHVWKTKSIVTPTCTTDGVENRKCKRCGKQEQIVIPAKQHQVPGWSSYKDKSTGKIMSTGVCKNCGKQIIREVTVNKKGKETTKYIEISTPEYEFKKGLTEDKIRVKTTGSKKYVEITYEEYLKTYMKGDPALKDISITDENRNTIAYLGFCSHAMGISMDNYEGLVRAVSYKTSNFNSEEAKAIRNVSVATQNINAVFQQMKTSRAAQYSNKTLEVIEKFTNNKQVKAVNKAVSNVDSLMGKADKISKICSATSKGEETEAIISALSGIIGKVPVLGKGYSEVLDQLGPCVNDLVTQEDNYMRNFCNGSKIVDYSNSADDYLWTCSFNDLANGISEDGTENPAMDKLSKYFNNDDDLGYFLEERAIYELAVANGDLKDKSFYQYFDAKYTYGKSLIEK